MLRITPVIIPIWFIVVIAVVAVANAGAPYPNAAHTVTAGAAAPAHRIAQAGPVSSPV